MLQSISRDDFLDADWVLLLGVAGVAGYFIFRKPKPKTTPDRPILPRESE